MSYDVTLILGDGIGPEVINATKLILDSCPIKFNWDIVEAGESSIKKYGTPLPQNVIDSINRNKIALKGPVTTPIGTGFKSVNVTLRQTFDLYANIRPVKTIAGVPSKYDNVNLIIVRENSEDLYKGIEHMVGDDAAESIKIITRKASERIVDFAFNLAVKEKRKKVTSVHKANIMKCTDGLFLNCSRKVAQNYPEIVYEEMIVDAMSMKLVMSPEKYDVLVMPNLYGDILSDLAAGLVGGLGMVPGANIGNDIAIFEPVHGSAPDIAGQNKANPTAAILSSVMMLRYLGELDIADSIENALNLVLKQEEYKTFDMGGNTGTIEFAKAVIKELK
ncbi:isocitrate/isopropylmalate dehydrogenase family protein [Caloramator sp. E03]|uniref:isocitrate/isopropylmalate dehydrogenase family protein n=1 Tax=Caloramator sp. E03 TaxID=2576307 RepID=UPI0011101CF1|nr:isocitrate/isopropylmalate dehydrogenase family protein [Caloramator sp. E03]QCX34548.1 isocitrate/isopropylmalate dehydrogenase family protein [Caloramator sp. E03]